MNKVFWGDCRVSMRQMIAEGVKVQMCLTSPPYWRQRDYGCVGQLGLEQTPEEYTKNLVEAFRLVRELLADDGTLFLNLGDKWASGGHGGGGSYMEDRKEAWAHAKDAKGWRSPPPGYKDKDLIGVPWMVAFALRADGWFLRQCNIWAKPNCMPESVTDRSTASHEYVFHLSKSANYFYDNDAARTPAAPSSETRLAQNVDLQAGSDRANGGAKSNGAMKAVKRSDKQRENGANLRSVWWIAPAQYREAHFAVMPQALAEICILAGSHPGDIVFDPFLGSGTVAQVAQRLGRQWIGCELQETYRVLQDQRTAQAGIVFYNAP